jgi:hypothetical protein
MAQQSWCLWSLYPTGPTQGRHLRRGVPPCVDGPSMPQGLAGKSHRGLIGRYHCLSFPQVDADLILQRHLTQEICPLIVLSGDVLELYLNTS